MNNNTNTFVNQDNTNQNTFINQDNTNQNTNESYYKNKKPKSTMLIILAAFIIIGSLIFSLWSAGVFNTNTTYDINQSNKEICDAALTYANNNYSEFKTKTGKILYTNPDKLENEKLLSINLINYLINTNISTSSNIRLEVLDNSTFKCHGFLFSEDDTTKPIITLKGKSTINSLVGETVTDPGATALDDKDGDISDKIVRSGSVDINTVGTYIITYSVVDVSGNISKPVYRVYEVD